MQKCVAFLFIFGTNYITMDNTKLLQQIARSVHKEGYVETAFPAGTVGTANADGDSILVDVSKMAFGNMNMQVIATGFTSADASVHLEQSNNGTNWYDVTDSTITLAAGASSPCITAAYAASQYVRAVFAFGTNAAGTFEVLISFK